MHLDFYMNDNTIEKREQPKIFPIADFLGIRFISHPTDMLSPNFWPDQSMPIRWELCTEEFYAIWQMPRWESPSPARFKRQSFTTLELKINFLRPIWTGLLKAEAHVVSRGRTVGLVECKITDDKQRLISKSNSTCMVLAGEAAKNR